MRLRSRKEFQRVAREGKRLVGRFLCIDYRRSDKSKLGISASARYGSAPERNRFKRLVREAFRNNYSILPRYELNVVPRQLAKNARFADISEELTRLLYQEGMKNRNMPRRRPEFESGEAGPEAAKLKKFSDAGGSQIQCLSDEPGAPDDASSLGSGVGRADFSVTSGIK